jgi:SNF2 family DNA or RNA helicase
LEGRLRGDSYVWSDLPTDALAVTTEKIINHFKRYDISIDLDNGCNDILRQKREDDEAFLDLISRGSKAKRSVSVDNRNQVAELLAPEYRRTLKDFQLDAVYHLLVVNNGANFSVPGSGKTSIALAYYHILLKEAKIDGLLVIGPASCFEPWEHEYDECFGVRPNSVRIAGVPKIRRNELYLLAGQYDMLLTTYQSAMRDASSIIESLKRRRYLVVLDEAHYIKRPQGGKTADAIMSLSRHASRRIILTGTPMPNGLEDLWSQFAFLWRDRSPLGTVESYLREIQTESFSQSIISIKGKIDPLFARITKRQLSLPKAVFHIVSCDLSPLQSRIYEGVAIRFLSQLKEEPSDREALREWRRARAVRLLQIASNPTLLRKKCDEFLLPPMEFEQSSFKQGIEYYSKYEIPCKFRAVERIVTQLCDLGSKVIIWTSFVQNLKMLAHLLSDYESVLVYGGVPFTSSDEQEWTREQLLTRFKSDKQCKLLIANPAACAESISLHKVCHHAIYLDRTFNCTHYMQSLDRIHRLGLEADRQTHYYLVLANNSIDEVINDRLKQKMLNMEHILQDDLPGLIPGYWRDCFGDEDYVGLEMVEQHIRNYARQYDNQTQ